MKHIFEYLINRKLTAKDANKRRIPIRTTNMIDFFEEHKKYIYFNYNNSEYSKPHIAKNPASNEVGNSYTLSFQTYKGFEDFISNIKFDQLVHWFQYYLLVYFNSGKTAEELYDICQKDKKYDFKIDVTLNQFKNALNSYNCIECENGIYNALEINDWK